MNQVERMDYRRIGARANSAARILESVLIFVLAICPLLQHYKGIFSDASSDLMILLFPFLCFRLFARRRLVIGPAALLALYSIYISFIHGVDFYVLGREVILSVVFLSVLNGCIDIRRVINVSVKIAIFACILEIIQYISYYILNRHMQLVPTNMLLDSAHQWVRLAQTGRISVTGSRMSFYRPSAFFLEPSHLAIYSMPALVMTLLPAGMNRRRMRDAILISLGMLLSTSGLGIAYVVMTWGLYGMFYLGRKGKVRRVGLKDILRPRSLLFILAFIVLAVVLYNTVDVFRMSVNRIFFSVGGERTAIQGRTSAGISLARSLVGRWIWIGLGDTMSYVNINLSGFFYTVVKFGIIGTVMYYIFYLRSLFRLKREFFWLCFMIVILSFFTVHTYATFYRMYFISFLLGGYRIAWEESRRRVA